MITAGTICTTGFVKNRTRNPRKPYPWLYRYGFCGYGYGVGNPDPRYTRDEPYSLADFFYGNISFAL